MNVEVVVERKVSIVLHDMTPKQVDYLISFFQNAVCDPSQEDPEIKQLRHVLWEKLCVQARGSYEIQG